MSALTPADEKPETPGWKRAAHVLQGRVFAYDFDPAASRAKDCETGERRARAVAALLSLAFFLAAAWLIATGRVDNKPTTASTGLVGIHNSMTLHPQRWFSEGIWWYQKQTPTPLPFTAIGVLFMIVGYSPMAVLILHSGLGALCGYLLFRVSQRRFGGPTGLVACLVLFSLPLFLYVTLSGWTFVWATTSLLLALTLFDRYHVSRRLGWYLLAAAAIACAGMSRPENYMVAAIAAVFVPAPWRYRPLMVLIAFSYPLAQYLHNNVYLDATPGLRILNDERATMTLTAILGEWAADVYRNIVRKSYSPLFLALGGAGVVLFGIPRRRFYTSILLYFIVALGAAYAMRRLSFNHEGYFYAHLVLLVPFIAHAIWSAASLAAAGLRQLSVPRAVAWAGGAAVVAGLLGVQMYQQRRWIESRLFFRISPEIKAARDFLRAHAGPDDPVAVDYVGETTWLLGELESDTGRTIWFYSMNSRPRPKVNAARADAPRADIEAMNVWVASGFQEWARQYRPKYLFVSSDQEWSKFSAASKTRTPYQMFGLRPALDQVDFAAVPIDADGSILRGTRVFENSRVWIYETQAVMSTTYTALETTFDDWAASPPEEWAAAPDGAVEITSGEPERGGIVLLRPAADAFTSLGRKLRDAAFVPGEPIDIQVDVKSSDPGLAVLVVGFAMQDGLAPVNFKTEHPGDGTWQTLRVRAEVPAKAAPGICYLSVVRRSGGAQPVLADKLVVRVLREAGSEAQ